VNVYQEVKSIYISPVTFFSWKKCINQVNANE